MEGKNRNNYLLLGLVVLLVVGLGAFFWVKLSKKTAETKAEREPLSEEIYESGEIETPAEERVIEATVDDYFAVSLESNPTTGYKWEADFDADYLELQGEEYTTHIKEQIVGAGGTEIFTFKALKRGETEIVFSYKRPWEGGEEKKQIHKVIIE